MAARDKDWVVSLCVVKMKGLLGRGHRGNSLGRKSSPGRGGDQERDGDCGFRKSPWSGPAYTHKLQESDVAQRS